MATTRKTFNDLEKLANLRNRIVDEIQLILSEDEKVKNWSKTKIDMLQTLAKNILPRLNEITGQDGNAIEIKGVEISLRQ